MSGFREDVISILKDNVMFDKETLGWIMNQDNYPQAEELLKEMEDRKFPVTGKNDKSVVLYDYVVIPFNAINTASLMKAFANLAVAGIIVLEISDVQDYFENSYISYFGKFSATKLKYGDNYYLVIHTGIDYGN